MIIQGYYISFKKYFDARMPLLIQMIEFAFRWSNTIKTNFFGKPRF